MIAKLRGQVKNIQTQLDAIIKTPNELKSMKNLIGILIAASTLSSSAQVTISHNDGPPDAMAGISDAAYATQMRIYNTQYMDPWRVVNGITNQVTDRWIQFSGKVLEVHDGGVRIDGQYFCPTDYSGAQNFSGEFFVKGFPYAVAQDDTVGGLRIYRAYNDGIYKYNTVAGGARTLHQLNYGEPCEAPAKSAAEVEAERALAAKKKIEGAAATLVLINREAAEGDPVGQLRMAEHYRDGDGVETNFYKAKYLFMASAEQGNETAAKELVALTNSEASK